MNLDTQRFAHLDLAKRADGQFVELSRSPDERVFLAYDREIGRLVELHVLKGGVAMDATEKRSAFERATQASEIRGAGFLRILEVGEDDGVVYYASNLNDGEFLEDYIVRRGALNSSTVFALTLQLLDELIRLQSFHRLLARMRLDRLLITALEDAFLQLRVIDYGLSEKERRGDADSGRLVTHVCEAMFLMLTGHPFGGEHPDRFPILTALPSGLRTTLRAALGGADNVPTSLEKLRDDVREAFSSSSSSLQVRNPRKQLLVNDALMPNSRLQDLLLENVPLQVLLGGRFRVEETASIKRHPFSIPAVNVKTQEAVTVHLLPPSRIVDKTLYEAVPLQMWRFSSDRHPNILRSLSLWEGPDWAFLTEERGAGFTLSRLMAERMTLNPQEVLLLIKLVRNGLDQGVDCGVARIDLHPSNIQLCVGKGGAMADREWDRLAQRRLDAWPPFTMKLRPHLTMRSLYEPLLIEPAVVQDEDGPTEVTDEEFRGRALAALAAFLLTGERQISSARDFPEAVPDAVAAFVRESIDRCKVVGRAMPVAEYVERFEELLTMPSSEGLASRLRGQDIPIEEMESVGSVSDFENEWDEDERPALGFDAGVASLGSVGGAARHAGHGAIGMAIFGLVGIAVLGMGWWLLFAGEPAPEITAESSVKSEEIGAFSSQSAPEVTPEPSTIVSNVGESQSLPQAPAVPERTKAPVTIKRAIIPSEEEKEKFRAEHPETSSPDNVISDQPSGTVRPKLADVTGSRGE
ncbi:MAG: hypothetical protein H7A55_02495 [Verrucomicrobiaceae bacterium]|nr:hypothetical protein [Verrucomicrobiaceae bacterium]